MWNIRPNILGNVPINFTPKIAVLITFSSLGQGTQFTVGEVDFDSWSRLLTAHSSMNSSEVDPLISIVPPCSNHLPNTGELGAILDLILNSR